MTNNISPVEIASAAVFNATTISSTTTLGYATSTASDGTSQIAVITTLIFGLMVALSNGSLLLIFLIKRDTRKHLSLVQASNMINCLVGALFDLTLRLPLFILTEKYVASISAHLCHLMRLTPDFFMMAILMCLPLITAERLLKLLANPTWTPKRNKQIIVCLLSGAYIVAFIISMLPLTEAFGRGSTNNRLCEGTLKYGDTSFAFTYSGLTALSVILTFVFSVSTVIALKRKITFQKSKTKRRVLKRGVISSISLTVLLGVATVPFAIALQIVLTCGANITENKAFCDDVLPNIFRTSVVIQKLGFTLLPIILLRFNPTMRRRLWLSLKKPKQTDNIMTLSSANTYSCSSKNSDIGNERNQESEVPTTDADGDIFISLNEERQFPDEVIRRMHIHGKQRQTFMEIVDILSIISEASETNASSIHRSNSAANNYCSSNSSFSYSGSSVPTSGYGATLPRTSSVKRSYSNASYVSDDIDT